MKTDMHCIWTLPDNDSDFQRHMDYLHYNPVKHDGSVDEVSQWQFSSFHRLVENGVYPLDWSKDVVLSVGEAVD